MQRLSFILLTFFLAPHSLVPISLSGCSTNEGYTKTCYFSEHLVPMPCSSDFYGSDAKAKAKLTVTATARGVRLSWLVIFLKQSFGSCSTSHCRHGRFPDSAALCTAVLAKESVILMASSLVPPSLLYTSCCQAKKCNFCQSINPSIHPSNN